MKPVTTTAIPAREFRNLLPQQKNFAINKNQNQIEGRPRNIIEGMVPVNWMWHPNS